MFIQSRDEGQQKKERKKARLAKNPKGQSRQELEPKKKKNKARQAENPKGWSRQKLRPKKRRRRKEKKLENPTKLET